MRNPFGIRVHPLRAPMQRGGRSGVLTLAPAPGIRGQAQGKAKQMQPEWIAVDQDGHKIAAYAMRGDTVLARHSAAGLNDLPWDMAPGTMILVNGAAPSPANYTIVPAAPLGAGFLRSMDHQGPGDVYYINGLQQKAPAAVMNGPACAIAGFLAAHPGWDGVVCLVGDDSIWAQISANEVVSFQSFVTGRLCRLLWQEAGLLPGGGALPDADTDISASDGFDPDLFLSSLQNTLARPERLAAHLAEHQAQALLTGGVLPREALLGATIGAELAAAKPYWLGQNLALIGDHDACAPYAAALGAQGAPVTIAEGAQMRLAGLIAARHLAAGGQAA